MQFSLDSPDEQATDTIQLHLKSYTSERVFWFYMHGVVKSFKTSHSFIPFHENRLLTIPICPNPGGSCHYNQRKLTRTADLVEKPMIIAQGTTINGGYYGWVCEYSIH